MQPFWAELLCYNPAVRVGVGVHCMIFLSNLRCLFMITRSLFCCPPSVYTAWNVWCVQYVLYIECVHCCLSLKQWQELNASLLDFLLSQSVFVSLYAKKGNNLSWLSIVQNVASVWPATDNSRLVLLLSLSVKQKKYPLPPSFPLLGLSPFVQFIHFFRVHISTAVFLELCALNQCINLQWKALVPSPHLEIAFKTAINGNRPTTHDSMNACEIAISAEQNNSLKSSVPVHHYWTSPEEKLLKWQALMQWGWCNV